MNYGEKISPTPVKVTEHTEIAQKMAQEIIERFNPMEQNECLKVIYEMVKERRQNQLSEAKERVDFLAKSIESL